MTIVLGMRRTALALGFAASIVVASASAYAQEPTEAHLTAAREVITAVGATDVYDAILPAAAQALKTELINKDPNLQDIITATVDETALTLASRRKDLETEAARAYANSFTQEELKAISDFYKSAAGLKFKNEAPIVVREVSKAAQIWQNGVARDLAQEVGKKLSAITDAGSNAAEKPADVPADGAAPAADGTAPAADGGAAPAADGAAPTAGGEGGENAETPKQ